MADNRSLTRGFKILECLDQAGKPISVADVTRHTGLHRATAHRLLMVLVELGYVHKDPETKKYSTAFYLHTLGRREAVVQKIVGHAMTFLNALALETNAIAQIGALDGRKTAILASAVIGEPWRKVDAEGSRFDAHATAIGKALFSLISPGELLDLYAGAHLHALTKRTITSLQMLQTDLGHAKQAGFAIEREERTLGEFSVGAPIVNPYGRALVAVSISLPISRARDNAIDHYGAKVVECSNKIRGYLLDRPAD